MSCFRILLGVVWLFTIGIVIWVLNMKEITSPTFFFLLGAVSVVIFTLIYYCLFGQAR